MSSPPSSFYSLMEPSEKFNLRFPQVDDSELFQRTFDLSNYAEGEKLDDEDVELVVLGDGRYRLAEKLLGPFSDLPLNWGDEFYAHPCGKGQLLYLKVALPQRIVHYKLITSRFRTQEKAMEHIHHFGGGWETVAGGMLTISIPVESLDEFRAAMDRDDVWPRGIVFAS